MTKNKLLKTFLLLTAMLVGSATNVLGQTTLFLWQSDGSTTTLQTPLTATGGTAAFYGTAAPSTESAAYNVAVTDTDLKATGTKGHKLGTNTLYLKITLTVGNKLQAGDIIYICGYNTFRVGTGVTSNRANTDLAESVATGTSKTDYNVGSVTVSSTIGNNATEIYLSRAEGTGTGLAAVKIVRPTASAPTGLTFNPAEGTIITGKEITLSAIGATSIKWQWGSAAVTDTGDSSWDTAETYSNSNKPIAGEVGTTNNVLSMLASNATGKTVKSATYTIKASATPHTQTTVDGERTWDWAEQTCNWSSDLNCSDWGEFVMADFDGEVYEQKITFTTDFDATALKVSGQYPFRSNGNKYFQNAKIKLTTTVPGTLKFTFSNTGSSNSDRYVVVTDANGTHTGKVEAVGTEKKNESFDVVAGDITIDGTNNGGIRIYKIVFSPTVEDTEAPTLSSSTPENGATNVAVSGTIVLTFDEDVACTTNATLTPAQGDVINLTPAVDGKTVTYAYTGLTNSTEYTFSLAANSVEDLAGNAYASAVSFIFTTAAAAATSLTAVSDKTWIFDDAAWNNFSTKITVINDNMEIVATSSIDWENSSITVDQTTYTKSIKLKTSGAPKLHILVAPNSKVTVFAKGGTGRTLSITKGDGEGSESLLSLAIGNSASTPSVFYTGTDNADLYISNSGSSNSLLVYAVKVEPISAASVTITDAKYATFSYGAALDFTDTGVTAYIVTNSNNDNSSVAMTEIKKVPANTGLVLYAETAKSYEIPLLRDDAESITTNYLVANLNACVPSVDGEYYILAKDGDEVGFFKSSGGTLAANRAYLVLPDSNAPYFSFDFGGGTTALSEELRVNSKESIYYDLSGRRVAQPTKGLYIVNGKKVLVP